MKRTTEVLRFCPGVKAIGVPATNLSRPVHGLTPSLARFPSTKVLGYYQGVRQADASAGETGGAYPRLQYAAGCAGRTR